MEKIYCGIMGTLCVNILNTFSQLRQITHRNLSICDKFMLLKMDENNFSLYLWAVLKK